MKLSIGIVGLPNVGKSTLFNAITNASVSAENYPFCTIEPNTGIVPVPDERLLQLAKCSGSQDILYATIEFVDIAGLVKGASKGEGLGNKFLANIRETSAIVHVVRCFDDPNTIHVHGKVDPLSDVETITLELIFADLDAVEKQHQNALRKAKSGAKDEQARAALLDKIRETLLANKPARQTPMSPEEALIAREFQLLTGKKVIYCANVSEEEVGTENAHVQALKTYATSHGDEVIVLCAKLESELAALDDNDKRDLLDSYGIKEPGLHQLARSCFTLLGLQTYLTTGPKESRAWTILQGDTAPKAAGVIHTDFEKGFIRANIINYQDFIRCNGWKTAKEQGLVRQEGKDYVMQDGDVVEFLFNV